MKIWNKPKLVILVRGTADEFVLNGCKGTGYDAGPVVEKADCEFNDNYCGPCEAAV
jgi:hypothetical protein